MGKRIMKIRYKEIPLLEYYYKKILFWDIRWGRRISKEQIEFNDLSMKMWKKLEAIKADADYIYRYRLQVAESYARMSVQYYKFLYFGIPYAKVIDYERSTI